MIDVANYNRAIEWLKRGIAEQGRVPESDLVRDGLFHSVRVTYNVTERILREALSELSDDALIPGLTSSELMRFAADEGLTLSSSTMWLTYGLALEQANDTLGESFTSTVLPLLPQYTQDLESFAKRLEKRLSPSA